MTIRETTIHQTLTDWADRLDLPVTVQDLAAAAVEVDRQIRYRLGTRRRTAVAATKPGATPDDARRIAARLEATYTHHPSSKETR